MMPSNSYLWRSPYLKDLDLASAWLQKCCQSHDSCSITNSQDRQRPTRLVSVKDDNIKLVLTAELGETMPPYATLSYCWGTESFMMLKCGNLADFLVRIPHEEMPKTFQDAVLVVRKLGLGYIWIDALCIIQDSPNNEDWSHESNIMGSVYSGSHINIAASTATGVFGGMFTKSRLYCSGFTARLTATNDGQVSGYSSVRNFCHPDTYAESYAETHLATRAWALQEKLLPARTLSIGDRGLFWECRNTVCSEYCPDGIHPFLVRLQVRAEDKEWEWHSIVAQYSRADLTYGSDKLPALSGIVARQRRITKDTYLAGLWRRQLHLQLDWRVQIATRKPRPEWRAPSWSWMSIDGGIAYPIYDKTSLDRSQALIHVLNAWTSPAELDGCGRVLDGRISLLCSGLVGGYVTHGNGTIPDTFMIKTNQKKLHVTMDCLRAPSDEIEAPRIFLLPTMRGPTTSQHGISIDVLKNMDIPIDLIRLGTDYFYDDERDGVRYFYELFVSGLVLEQVDNEPGHFCRVGSFELCRINCPDDERFDTEENQHYRHFLSALAQIGTATAEAVCNKATPSDEQPEMKYELTIK